MSWEEDIPRRKKDPLKNFRDPKIEAEEHYKQRVRMEEEELRFRLGLGSGKARKKKPESKPE